jgi:hypothetical protein
VQCVINMLPPGEEESAGQSSQLPDPVAFLYLPAPHASHVPPSAPDQPTLQVQLLKAVLCGGELEPSGQLLQLSAPDTFLYLPSPHGVHVCPSVPDQPALQVQFVMLMLALGESELIGQVSQLPAPFALFHFPASHAVHAPPLKGPEYPSLHLHCVKSVLCSGELEFAGQLMQAPSPGALLYLPAPHGVHDASADLPVCAPYLPAPQSWQVEIPEAPCSAEYFPVPHSVQLADPVDSLYLPGAHAMHADPE